MDDEDEIIAQVKRLKPDVLHLCANYEGNPAFREKLRQEAPDVLLMEAVGVTGPEAIEVAREKAKFADMLILDTVSPPYRVSVLPV